MTKDRELLSAGNAAPEDTVDSKASEDDHSFGDLAASRQNATSDVQAPQQSDEAWAKSAPATGNTTASRDEIAKETEEETSNDGGNAPQQQEEEAESKSVPATGNVKILELADLAELVRPSVVHINVTGPKGAFSGSGFVLDKQGTIVTNFHVIEDATAGRIVFSDKTSTPIIGYLGVWPEKDIALVQVECPADKLHPLRLATSAPRQGERVAAFGSPLGLQQSVSEGIVSALRPSKELRTLGPIDINAILIQTSTPISEGNSGGPLVDMKGMVVGVNTLGSRTGQNLNFAVAAVELPPLLLAKNEIPSPLPAYDPARRTPAAEAKPGQVVTNSIGMKLVTIPAGSFMMGSHESPATVARDFAPEAKAEYFEHEHPQHRIRISKAFGMGVHEVTRGQFRRFVEATGYKTEPERDGEGGWGYNAAENKLEGRKVKYTWRNTGFNQTDSHPVVNVTWNDAVAFCEALSRKEGKTYRLPTEAEWEYACRAGSTARYQHGEDPEGLAKVGNVADRSAGQRFSSWTTIQASDGAVFTAPVGSYLANGFGLHDMHGNVWEWCSDWYSEDYYGKSPTADPTGPGSRMFRVTRGGAWDYGPVLCRSAYRFRYAPATRSSSHGFRVVLVLE